MPGYDPVSKVIRRALDKGDMEALRLSLNPRMRRFCEEYIVDFNGSAAAIRAGYATKFSDRRAHLLHRHEGVSVYIDHLSRSKEAKITAVDPDYVIQKTLDIINKEGARDGDKLRGLEMIARHLGMFIERKEISGPDGGAIEIAQKEAAEKATNLVDALRRLRERSEDRDDTSKDVKELTVV